MIKSKEFRKILNEAKEAQEDGNPNLFEEAMGRAKAFQVFHKDYFSSLNKYIDEIGRL